MLERWGHPDPSSAGTVVHVTIHSQSAGNTGLSIKIHGNACSRQVEYSVYIGARVATLYVDDAKQATVPISPELKRHELCFIANIAIGAGIGKSAWVGTPDAAAMASPRMIIDHIRAYEVLTSGR